MSSTPKLSLEAETTKEEEWEVLSGAKSLETSAGAENKNDEDKFKEVNEDKILEVNETDPVEDAAQRKNEIVDENEPQDWYQTLPTTPMNTPEYSPVAPGYPTANRKMETDNNILGDVKLSPITEVLSEEQNPTNTPVLETNVIEPVENVSSPSDDLQTKDKNLLRKSVEMIGYILTRLTLFIIVFSFLKWSFAKACEKIRKLKSHPETKEAVK